MKISALTLLILQINSAIDSGKYTDITISEIHQAIENKRVLRYLKERLGSDIDLSLHIDSNTFGDFESFYENELDSIYGGYAGQEGRKWGVENSGLCLVLAWTNEIVQHGNDLSW